MKIITPFAIPAEHKFEIELPRDAEVLSVSVQDSHPHLWILHDPNAIFTWRTFILIPGGSCHSLLSTNTTYIGCFKTKTNRVFIFEEISNEEKGVRLNAKSTKC